MRTVRNLLIFLWVLSAVVPVAAGGLHGRVQLTGQMSRAGDDSLDAALGDQHRKDANADLRLTWESRWNHWDTRLHYQVSTDAGDSVAYNRRAASFFTSAAPGTLLDLTRTLHDGNEVRITHTVDRMAIGYSAPGFVVRVGRQALTWGEGRMFQVMDLVAPFAPNTLDTEYKPGVDMAYGQLLFDDGSDLQWAAVPRADVSGESVHWDASTVALYYRHAFGELGTRWLLSHNYNTWTAGAGASGPLHSANWNVEIVPVFGVDGKTRISGLANINYAMTLLKRNATLFSEFYHNGFGIDSRHAAYNSLPAYLTDRLARGQVFNLSRNYLAGGMTLEWTPLVSLSPSLIANLDDHSFYASAQMERSLGDNATLLMGAQIPIGPSGTEYGGIPLSNQPSPHLAPPALMYVQVRRYF